MFQRSTLGALLLVLGLGSFAVSKPAALSSANDGEATRVGELIQQLGSTKFHERNAAQKELEAIGAPALPQLKKAVLTKDLETSKRAGELVRKMEERVATAALLAPKRVHLKVKDMPVLDAVSELTKLSGYPIQVLGDRTKVADKKITLDTGDVAFWEAFDKLCTQAGLVEQIQPANVPPTGIRFKLNVNPPQILPVPAPANPRPAPELKPVNKEPELIQAPVRIEGAKDIPAVPGLGAKAALAPLAEARVQAVQALAQVQVQIQPAAPAVQFQGGVFEVQPFGGQPSGGQLGIALVPGSPKNHHVSYAGSVRARVFAAPKSAAGEYRLTLEASAEPRLQGFTLVGNPTIDKAIDDQGQKLILNTEPIQANPVNVPRIAPGGFGGGFGPGMPILGGQRQATLRFKAGEKPAKRLKELSGTFTAQVVTPPEPLIILENVLKAIGETAKGKSGGALKLNSIAKEANGDYKVQVYMENAPGQNGMGGMILGNGVIQMQQVQIQVGAFGGNTVLGNTSGLPELLDAKGNKFQAVQVPARRMNFNNGIGSQEITIIYRGQGDPDRLVLQGTRTTNITIPFAFQNVDLE